MRKQVQDKPRLVVLSGTLEDAKEGEDRACMACLRDIKPGEFIVVNLYTWYGWHCHEAEDPFERVYHLHCPDGDSPGVWLEYIDCFESTTNRRIADLVATS